MDEEEEEEVVQAKSSSSETHDVPQHVEYQIYTLRGGGKPLPESVRNSFEPRFGYDFSKVRLHTDSNAVNINRGLNAQAFTHGRDIYFGTGSYSLATTTGKKLLAHELAHVIQQRSMAQPKIQKQSIHNPLFPCHETAFMPGGMDFFGTLVHLAIQQYYVSNIDPMAGTEYVIPGSSAGGATGRADIVDSIGGVYEIKPLGLVVQGFIEAENYVLHAETNCDPQVYWHLGTWYFPPAGPMIINGFLIISWLYGPGVIAYTRRAIPPAPVRVPETEPVERPVREPVREPRPAPDLVPEPGLRPVPVANPSTYKLILEWARHVIESGADAAQAADEFLRQHPETAWTILILGVAGIIALAADDVTLAGIADDVLIPLIAALMRVAWRFA
jgi:hypothetical protein